MIPGCTAACSASRTSLWTRAACTRSGGTAETTRATAPPGRSATARTGARCRRSTCTRRRAWHPGATGPSPSPLAVAFSVVPYDGVMTRYLHTMYRITDPEKSRAFYEALGFTFARDMDIVRDGEVEATNYFFSMGDQDSVLEL